MNKNSDTNKLQSGWKIFVRSIKVQFSHHISIHIFLIKSSNGPIQLTTRKTAKNSIYLLQQQITLFKHSQNYHNEQKKRYKKRYKN